MDAKLFDNITCVYTEGGRAFVMYQPHVIQDIRRGLQRRLEALARNMSAVDDVSAEDLVQIGNTARTLSGNINSLQSALPEDVWHVYAILQTHYTHFFFIRN